MKVTYTCVVEGMMNKITKFLRFIHRWFDGSPKDWIGSTSNRTRFGEMIDRMPAIVAVVFLAVYYLVTSPIWLIVGCIILVTSIVIQLFTRRWEDIDFWGELNE